MGVALEKHHAMLGVALEEHKSLVNRYLIAPKAIAPKAV